MFPPGLSSVLLNEFSPRLGSPDVEMPTRWSSSWTQEQGEVSRSRSSAPLWGWPIPAGPSTQLSATPSIVPDPSLGHFSSNEVNGTAQRTFQWKDFAGHSPRSKGQG